MSVDFGPEPCKDSPLVLYLHGELRAHRVTLNSRDVQFTEKVVFHAGDYSMVADAVSIDTAGLVGMQQVAMTYGGLFNPSCASSPSNYMTIDTQGAYLRGYGYSLWFPTTLRPGDEVLPVEFDRVAITTPARFTAVFTGDRIREESRGPSRVSTWRASATSPLDVQLTVRPYLVEQDQGVHLYLLDNAASRNAAADILSFVRTIRKHYADNYKAVEPTEQIHIAELPNFASGISSGNMIGITSGQWRRFSLADDDTSMELLVSHELVHQYVHTPVSLQSPLAALVIEGFPSYFHLHTLATVLGEKWYQSFIRHTETNYLRRKSSGVTSRGRQLPPEKPILEISFDEIGRYKDTFILNDRVLLFLNSLRQAMGQVRFREFTRALCNSRELSPSTFKELVVHYLPEARADLAVWLESNEYPERLRLGAQLEAQSD